MFKHRAKYAMPLVAFAALAVPQLGAAEVRDRGGIFTAEAIKKAETVLDRIERRTKIPVVIETIEAIPGLARDSSASEKRTAVERVAEQRARELGYEGVYLLISKNDHVISRVLVKKRYDSLLPLEKRDEVRDTLTREFKGGRFDEGLLKTTALLDSALAEAPAVSGNRRAVPGVPAPGRGDVHGAKFGLGTLLLVIGLGIVGVLLLLRVLGGVFGRAGGGYSAPMGMGGMPGPGTGPGPGYGPGYGGGSGAPRGGFFSGMLGGLGGALAGNWLYDQFSGRHGGAGHSDAAAYPAAESPAPADQGGDDFVGGNDDGGQGTSWSDPGGADAGGNWGGGDGGGDWGGGGGDWGGGGGGGGD